MKKKMLEKIIENQQFVIDELSAELKLLTKYSKETLSVLCAIIEEQTETIIDIQEDKEDIADMISPDLLHNAIDGEEALSRVFGDTDGDPKEVFDD